MGSPCQVQRLCSWVQQVLKVCEASDVPIVGWLEGNLLQILFNRTEGSVLFAS
jgi:hypothetical protein